MRRMSLGVETNNTTRVHRAVYYLRKVIKSATFE
jgi:hypothetical protein